MKDTTNILIALIALVSAAAVREMVLGPQVGGLVRSRQ